MGLLDGLIKSKASDLAESLNGIVDTISTSDSEKLDAKEKIAAITLKSLTDAAAIQASVIETEIGGSALQRNWRPIVMLVFAFIITYEYFIAPAFVLNAIDIPVRFWDLLQLGMGGYVVGRSVEKIADTVTKNIDLTFLKKKDRNESKL